MAKIKCLGLPLKFTYLTFQQPHNCALGNVKAFSSLVRMYSFPEQIQNITFVSVYVAQRGITKECRSSVGITLNKNSALSVTL